MSGLHILGGGPAGLAAAHFAHRRNLSFTLHEAGAETGGNCRTLAINSCLYDTGAHRLHPKDSDATRLFHDLLGDDLITVNAPSRIVRGTKTFAFPPEPLDLLRGLSLRELAGLLRDLARGLHPENPTPHPRHRHFQDLAVSRYGITLAELFLLGYTRKLWGRDPVDLSPEVAGGRLEGLSLRAVLRKILGTSSDSRSTHLDGAFLYPKRGIGSLFQRLQARLPAHAVHLDSRVARIRHEGNRIVSVTVNGKTEEAVETVISTLPLPAFLRALDPPPPPDLLARCDKIEFRNLILVVVHLAMDRFSENASLYFPDSNVPFTRLYEPKNRSPFMAPAGETCIVLEIPCDPGDQLWNASDDELATRSLSALEQSAALPRNNLKQAVLGRQVQRIGHAYPVLNRGIDQDVSALLEYCNRFTNLRLAGRNALFRYAHIHDMIRQGRAAVESLSLSDSDKKDSEGDQV